MKRREADAVLADLRDGKLRDIRPRLERLTAAQKRAVARDISRLLEEAVSKETLAPSHRWLITALQFLAPPQADDLLTRTLAQATDLEGCCGCTLNRTMRALGALRPPHAIPALADVIHRAEHPRHKHLAAVCIQKIVESRGPKAEMLLAEQSPRLRRALHRLHKDTAAAAPVTPSRPWLQPPGSPGWLAAADRAAKGIARLLAQRPAA